PRQTGLTDLHKNRIIAVLADFIASPKIRGYWRDIPDRCVRKQRVPFAWANRGVDITPRTTAT
ncbi:MAG: hypothetical protein ACYST6_21215, partial [Planctomycetota bacterium]